MECGSTFSGVATAECACLVSFLGGNEEGRGGGVFFFVVSAAGRGGGTVRLSTISTSFFFSTSFFVSATYYTKTKFC